MKRTDLALEEKESIEGDKEIAGVVLEEETMEDGKVKISKVEIKDKHGSEVMRKPMGSYITIETKDVDLKSMKEITCSQLKKLFGNSEKSKIMVVGLGNREITPDALGPKVIDQLFVTRHLIREFGKEFQKRNHFLEMCALAPGVMAQTGMEKI